MKGTSAEKVFGGKLVRAEVDYGFEINFVKLTGDFFMHPEEKLEEIEKSMRGIEKDADHETIAKKVREAVDSHGIILFGVTEDAIARVVKGAMK